MNLALMLDDEFKRVAKAEQISMEDLVTDVARLVGCSTRQIYNYRSGKWELPGSMIPTLCKRFASLSLLHELAGECASTEIEVPESYELTRMISGSVQTDMIHYGRLLDAFDSDGIDRRELDELEASGARVVENIRMLEEIARQDYERRTALKQ
jgi:hypothetical protein